MGEAYNTHGRYIKTKQNLNLKADKRFIRFIWEDIIKFGVETDISLFWLNSISTRFDYSRVVVSHDNKHSEERQRPWNVGNQLADQDIRIPRGLRNLVGIMKEVKFGKTTGSREIRITSYKH